jgi:hypothetical protein
MTQMAATEEQTAAEAYFEAVGSWPEGYTPPGEETEEDKQKKAAQAFYDAVGYWPGQNPPKVKQEEAPEDAFSHYLDLANGQTVRFAVNPRNGLVPTEWNGVPVVKVHNSHAPTQGE